MESHLTKRTWEYFDFTNYYLHLISNFLNIRNIINFVKKYGINPVNGDKMDTSELIELHYHKNVDGNY